MLAVRADGTGTTDLEIEIHRIDDEGGDAIGAEVRTGVFVTGPPRSPAAPSPRTADGDVRYRFEAPRHEGIGRDTLVDRLTTRPHADVCWLASFDGEKPERIERYVSRVRKRAASVRQGARERGVE